VALLALSLLLLALSLSYPGVRVFDLLVPEAVKAVSFSTLGVLIVPRRPKHPIGWLFCALGLLAGLDLFCGVYAIYALLAEPGSLLGGEVSAWIVAWVWVPFNALLVFLALLFPSGRLPSPRWRPFAALVVIVAVVGSMALALLPGAVSELGPIENPLGLQSLRNVHDLVEAVVEASWYPLLDLVAVASVFVRFRRARGVERQQIKWCAYTAAVLVVGAILTYGGSDATGARWAWMVGEVLLVVGFVGLPLVIGIAILRYRLYEIDTLINRTLVYGVLTAILALVYLGSVTALQYLFSLLTGQANTLAIVASTLAIAALFNPLRRRIQGFIDRRFYRRKYDAAKTLEVFGSRLRYETDLERISEDLLEVVHETMQPSHMSLWLRFPSSSSPKRSESRSSSEVRSSMQSEAPPQ
jgi:hypothetical protein